MKEFQEAFKFNGLQKFIGWIKILICGVIFSFGMLFKKEMKTWNGEIFTEVSSKASFLHFDLFLKIRKVIDVNRKKNFSRVFLYFLDVISHDFVRCFFEKTSK